MDDRTTTVIINGKKYELLLSLNAAKAIYDKFGGLSSLGEELMKERAEEEGFELMAWLFVLLANQTIKLHNLKNATKPEPLLSTEEIMLYLTPRDIGEVADKIIEACVKGARRDLQDQENDTENEKNA